MGEKPDRSISELLADNELMNAALARASREALLAHARAGHSVPISPDDQIIWLTPEQIFAKYSDEKSKGRE